MSLGSLPFYYLPPRETHPNRLKFFVIDLHCSLFFTPKVLHVTGWRGNTIRHCGRLRRPHIAVLLVKVLQCDIVAYKVILIITYYRLPFER